jgi:tRNA A-37 threonylcarbamoyl transferase component Bud32
MNSSWPSISQFVEAIDHPKLFLQDADLQKSKPEKNKFDRPLSWAGQFAVVFKMRYRSKTWAARCFTSPVEDHRERYAALSKVLRANRPACMVDFDYLQKGILVSGDWFPLLRMEWADGQPLDSFLEELTKKEKKNQLKTLAVTWLEMIRSLHQQEIAHGDLQHENILIDNGKILLVDYDGAYVPGLQGRSALEIGISHYQHPGRNRHEYHSSLDHFSSLVIYLSLNALADNPRLWDEFHEDKSLLFRDVDYKSPKNSKLFAKLLKSKNSDIALLTTWLRNDCLMQQSGLPPLHEILNNLSSPKAAPTPVKSPGPPGQTQSSVKPGNQRPMAPPRTKTSSLPDYLGSNDQLKQQPKKTSQKPRSRTNKLPDYLQSRVSAPQQPKTTSSGEETKGGHSANRSKKIDPLKNRPKSSPLPDYLKIQNNRANLTSEKKSSTHDENGQTKKNENNKPSLQNRFKTSSLPKYLKDEDEG